MKGISNVPAIFTDYEQGENIKMQFEKCIFSSYKAGHAFFSIVRSLNIWYYWVRLNQVYVLLKTLKNTFTCQHKINSLDLPIINIIDIEIDFLRSTIRLTKFPICFLIVVD